MLNCMLFEKIIKATQSELLDKILVDELQKRNMNDIVKTDDYILAHGNVPILLVAHMDTVHSTVEKIVIEKNIWTSPTGIGGDDRCGVYMILDIIEKSKHKPYVLFTTDEEIGGIGVQKFLKDFPYNEFDIKFMIEFDRKGNNEAVFYQCQNKEFIEFITKKLDMKYDDGSFTDICYIMDSWDIAGVNLSSGYYNAHTKKEYIVIDDMLNVSEKTIKFLDELDYSTLKKYDVQSYEYSMYYDDFDYWYDDEIVDTIFCEECFEEIPYDEYMENFGVCKSCMKKYLE